MYTSAHRRTHVCKRWHSYVEQSGGVKVLTITWIPKSATKNFTVQLKTTTSTSNLKSSFNVRHVYAECIQVFSSSIPMFAGKTPARNATPRFSIWRSIARLRQATKSYQSEKYRRSIPTKQAATRTTTAICDRLKHGVQNVIVDPMHSYHRSSVNSVRTSEKNSRRTVNLLATTSGY